MCGRDIQPDRELVRTGRAVGRHDPARGRPGLIGQRVDVQHRRGSRHVETDRHPDRRNRRSVPLVGAVKLHDRIRRRTDLDYIDRAGGTRGQGLRSAGREPRPPKQLAQPGIN